MKKSLKKSKKLVALEEGAKEIGSLAEAENAAAKIQDLLIKYNLSIEQIDTLVEKDEINKENVTIESKKSESNWVALLYGAIARHNFCTILLHNPGMTAIILVGEPVNKEIVKDLTLSLIPRIRNLEGSIWKDYQGFEKRGTFRRGFLRGAVRGINDKLREQAERLKTKDKQVYGLILRKDKAVEQFIKDNIGNIGKSKNSSLRGASGRSLGYEAGKKMGINRGIKNSIRNKLN